MRGRKAFAGKSMGQLGMSLGHNKQTRKQEN